jgi:hypothetical protein
MGLEGQSVAGYGPQISMFRDDLAMAAHGDMNIKAHVSTYDRVIGLLKWGTVACAVVAALVIWLIA